MAGGTGTDPGAVGGGGSILSGTALDSLILGLRATQQAYRAGFLLNFGGASVDIVEEDLVTAAALRAKNNTGGGFGQVPVISNVDKTWLTSQFEEPVPGSAIVTVRGDFLPQGPFVGVGGGPSGVANTIAPDSLGQFVSGADVSLAAPGDGGTVNFGVYLGANWGKSDVIPPGSSLGTGFAWAVGYEVLAGTMDLTFRFTNRLTGAPQVTATAFGETPLGPKHIGITDLAMDGAGVPPAALVVLTGGLDFLNSGAGAAILRLTTIAYKLTF